jgi:hypothetical protein
MTVLVVVHPGSLCGSADFNLGSEAAESVRVAITDELQNWTGDVLVLDGYLSDELVFYPELRDAINDAVDRAKGFGERLVADDPDHAQIAVDFLRQHALALNTPINLTGAWYDPEDEFGCVNATCDALKASGFSNITVLSSCAVMAEPEVATDLAPAL